MLAASELVAQEFDSWACLAWELVESVLVESVLVARELDRGARCASELVASELVVQELGRWACLGPASVALTVLPEASCLAVHCLVVGKVSGSRMARPAYKYGSGYRQKPGRVGGVFDGMMLLGALASKQCHRRAIDMGIAGGHHRDVGVFCVPTQLDRDRL